MGVHRIPTVQYGYVDVEFGDTQTPAEIMEQHLALIIERDRMMNQLSIDSPAIPAPVHVAGTGVPQAEAAAAAAQQTAITCGICGSDVWDNMTGRKPDAKGPAYKCKKDGTHVQWLQKTGGFSEWQVSQR